MDALPSDAVSPVSARLLRQALDDLLEGRSLAPGRVSAPVLASWERAMQWGLRPDASPFAETVPACADVQRVQDTHAGLIDVVSRRLASLHRGLPGGDRWVALCINSEGHIVHGVGQREAMPQLLQVALQVGRSVREADLGTTAVGCALFEQRVHVVRHHEHYLRTLSSLACAAVPFRSPEGHVAGVLDLTGVGDMVDPAAVRRLMLTARQVENDLLLRLPHRVVLHLNEDPGLMGTPYEGLISLDESATACYLNAAARQLLGLADQQASGFASEQLFDRAEWRRMLDAGSTRDRLEQVRDRRGFLLHVGRLDKRATAVAMPAREGRSDQPGVSADTGSPVDKDPSIAAILRTGVKALQRGVPLILEGESGTGKEVMAKAIHLHSNRASKPLVAINCAAIPEGLIEAELFGYVDGAFTGGRRGGCAGKILQAQGGTLFLDEIGDMPLVLQTRLLRVLQERQVTPVGGLHPVPVEFALICATHRNLARAVEQGAFRGDLFYRIDGLLLRLPALRERHDMKDLIQRFLLECSEGSHAVTLDDEAYGLFASYSWPGNIRQLRNVIRASAVLSGEKSSIGVSDLPEALRRELGLEGQPGASVAETPLEVAECETIRRILASVDGNVTRAAAVLGVSRSTLHKRLRDFGLR